MLLILFTLLQDPRPGALTITAPDQPAVTLSPADLAKLPRKTLRVTTEGGGQQEYAGIPLSEVLKLAKLPLGPDVRGRTLAVQVMIATTADGQRAVYALAELDPSFTETVPLLADRLNGKPLPPDEGPWRLIPPHDKRRARSLRQVINLQVKKL